jgi:formylglycine-generating enzyme required for sulfatase activity
MSEVMISYARADARGFAERLATRLRGHYQVWLDTGNIEGGAEWLRRIQQAISGCRVFLAIRSPAGSVSSWVQRERLFAINNRKQIIPVLSQPCPSDDLELIIYQPVDFSQDFESAFDQLLTWMSQPADGALPARTDRRVLEQGYLGRVLLEYAVWRELYTPMAGVGQLLGGPARSKPRMVTLPTSIDPVFHQFVQERLACSGTKTRTTTRNYADLLSAVEDMRQLILLGDPGSGKTTTLWRIAVDYAQRARTDLHHALPILVSLGGLRPEQDLEQHLVAQLGELGPYYRQLCNEKRLAVLLDGLNELPAGERATHAAQVRALVGAFRQENMVAVVTCRELDYQGDLELSIQQRLTIAPLDPLRIRQFVSAYIKEPDGAGGELFWQLAGGSAQGYWRDFRQSGLDERSFWLGEAAPWHARLPWGDWESWLNERDHPRSMLVLARNPFMLYMMTQVFTLEARLPPNRGLLFSWFIDFLLLKREKVDEATTCELKRRLAELAYAMQAAREGTSFSPQEVVSYLQDERSIYLAQSANILSTGEDIRFSHQLLQEFFAAHKLDRELRAGKPAASFWPAKSWWESQGWEETAVLLAGLYNDDLTPVLEWLRDTNPEVASRCAVESGAHTPQPAVEKLRSAWLPRLTGPQAESRPEPRAAVGRALGWLGLDDRPGVGLRPDGLPAVAWCEVPAGPFRMGGDFRVEGSPWEGAVIDIHYRYWIAKYPVTYAQFAPFVEEDGYKTRAYWTEAGWRWKGDRTRPHYWNYPRWHISNHPVVGITWYEAYAYAQWLNARLPRTPALVPAALRSLAMENLRDLIRLPTEAEWEKAARYPDGRLFPWGDHYIAGYANVNEKDSRARRRAGRSELKRTTAVGLYAQGASPIGAFDLCGNVFDWCLSAYTGEYHWPEVNNPEGEASRMARGGAWLRSVDAGRAAYREEVPPGTVYDDQGFRLCASADLLNRQSNGY